MTEPATLFELEPPATSGDTPRCRMCARPARWLQGQQQWAMYCAGKACSNRERTCQKCSNPFVVNVDGAGTKYCSTECKIAGYHPRPETAAGPRCAWCGKPHSTVGMGRKYQNRIWPYICQPCLDPIRHVVDRLRRHHLPHQRARQLIEDPGCEVCGTDLLVKVRQSGQGKLSALLVVDHDHTCCPVDSHSCGQCIRGLICTHCNTAAGLLKDEPKHARSLADYLDRWFSR